MCVLARGVWRQGNCWVYENDAGIRIVFVMFAFCTWMFYDVTLCNRGKVTDEIEMN